MLPLGNPSVLLPTTACESIFHSKFKSQWIMDLSVKCKKEKKNWEEQKAQGKMIITDCNKCYE